MKTLFRLLTLFMTVPIVELFFLIQVERLFDTWTGGNGLLLTGALIITTAVIGSYLAKREGLSAWNRLQSSFSEGGLPGDELLDAVIILMAGAFLITPGVLTDLIGFSGLLPFSRNWIRGLVKRRLKKAVREGRIQTTFGAFGAGMGDFSAAGGEMPGSTTPGDGMPETGEAGGPSVGGTPATRGPSAAAAAGDGSSATPPSAGEPPSGSGASGEAAPQNGSEEPRKLPGTFDAGEGTSEAPDKPRN